MPLLDHFHPPLSVERHWEAFHGRWAAAIADRLNEDLLPQDYFAEFQVHVGSSVEVDVASFHDARPHRAASESTTTTLPKVWTPPAPSMVVPIAFPDSLEVLVFSQEAGPTLVAAIELVSPGNKDREETRRAFAAKCSSYLQQGIGLMAVDVVTNRQANLHDELVAMLGADPKSVRRRDDLYATAYRPVRREQVDEAEVWVETLVVGKPLPTLPLPLDKGFYVPVDLDVTYNEACERSRLR